MIKERVLDVGIDEAIGLFEIRRWKFWELYAEEGIVRVEVPRGFSEVYVVEFRFSDDAEYKDIVDKLSSNGFIKQTIRRAGDF